MLYRDADIALRAAIWRRFAVMGDDGDPVRCGGPHDRFNKITFDDQRAARGAVAELVRLYGTPMYVHACRGPVRDRTALHWHLTRRPQKEEEHG